MFVQPSENHGPEVRMNENGKREEEKKIPIETKIEIVSIKSFLLLDFYIRANTHTHTRTHGERDTNIVVDIRYFHCLRAARSLLLLVLIQLRLLHFQFIESAE